MNLSKKSISKEQASLLLFVVVFIVYSLISLTKNVYPASIASIVGEGIFTKSSAGIINASFYLFYGSIQLLGARLTDKISPFVLVAISLAGSVISLVGMAISVDFYSMLFFWSLCGITQFAIWPAILRIVASYVMLKHQDRAKTYISFSYCVGMLLNYAMASVVLEVSSWQMMFVVSAVLLIVCLLVWIYITSIVKCRVKEILVDNSCFITNDPRQRHDYQGSFGGIIVSSGVLILLIPSFVRTAMDLGVKTWIPTMIAENYGVSPSFASVLTTVLVLINLGGIFISTWMYPKRVKSAVLAYSLCFLAALPFTVLLLLIGKINLIYIVLFLTVVTTLMYSGHQLINVIIPAYFAKYNKAGSVASILNAIASFGAVVANIAYGYIADSYGWNATIITWVILAIVGFVTCIIANPRWNKFIKSN